MVRDTKIYSRERHTKLFLQMKESETLQGV